MKNLLNFLIKYNYWFLFILLEGISFTLLFHFNSYQGSAFFTSANYVTGNVYQVQNELTGYFHLKTVNKELVKQNTELSLQLQAYRDKLMGLTQDSAGLVRMKQDVLMDYDIIGANVINNSITFNDNYITINKGEVDGVKSEMGVVGGTGVVGIVYITSKHFSIIIPILNSKSNISCKLKNNEYFGAMTWEGGSSQFGFINDMPRHAELSVGDTIVTSGHSAVFPKGLPIGTVHNINNSQDGLSFKLKVKLFTDFAKLHDVRVISRKDVSEQIELENQIEQK